ncbi:MAG: PLP-dependent aminotransferase family protein [Firmicutes bacterium]|nr:PLP-dependent aminotransferase family protein [Bacillota bacterium]
MTDWSGRFSHRARGFVASDIRDLLRLLSRPEVISFAGGVPASERFPVAQIAECIGDLLATPERVREAFQYGLTEGSPEMRRLLSQIMLAQGVTAPPSRILVTNGSQQGMDLLCRVLLDPGDTVLVEKPAYLGALQVFISYQADLVGIPIDEEGLSIDALQETLERLDQMQKRPKFLYLVPNYSNPTGVSLSLERRQALVRLAQERDLIVVEDNPYGEIRFEGNSQPPLSALADSEQVIYLGTFSKVFLPGLRLGWLVAPPALMERLVLAKQAADLCTNSFGQALAVEYARRGYLTPHVEELQGVYRERRDAMLAALDRFAPDCIQWTRPQGGFFIWVRLPQGWDARELLAECLEQEQVAYVAGKAFYCDEDGANTLRLSYSEVPPSRIEQGIRRLCRFFGRVEAGQRAGELPQAASTARAVPGPGRAAGAER